MKKKPIKLYSSSGYGMRVNEENPLPIDSTVDGELVLQDWLGSAPRHAYELAMAIKSAHWLIKGDEFITCHEYLDELFENAINDGDFFGELAVELGAQLYPLFGETGPEFESMFQCKYTPCTVDEGMVFVVSMINNYLEYINRVYGFITADDIKSEFDTLVRFWRKSKDFFCRGSIGGV